VEKLSAIRFGSRRSLATGSATRKIVDFRNLLVHGYSAVEADRVWDMIQQRLPRLLAEVRALLPPA